MPNSGARGIGLLIGALASVLAMSACEAITTPVQNVSGDGSGAGQPHTPQPLPAAPPPAPVGSSPAPVGSPPGPGSAAGPVGADRSDPAARPELERGPGAQQFTGPGRGGQFGGPGPGPGPGMQFGGPGSGPGGPPPQGGQFGGPPPQGGQGGMNGGQFGGPPPQGVQGGMNGGRFGGPPPPDGTNGEPGSGGQPIR